MNGVKKRIVAMMMISALSVWFALPNVVQAQTVTITIEGRGIYTSLTANSSSVTATISYTEGSGQIWARAMGEARSILNPNMKTLVTGSENSNPTPGGVSASISAPDGWRFYRAYSDCRYEVYINGTTYSNPIQDAMDL